MDTIIFILEKRNQMDFKRIQVIKNYTILIGKKKYHFTLTKKKKNGRKNHVEKY